MRGSDRRHQHNQRPAVKSQVKRYDEVMEPYRGVLELAAGIVLQRGGVDLQGPAAGVDDEEDAAASLVP